MVWFLAVISAAGIVYMVKYYLLTANLRRAGEELRSMKQNPDENRILFYTYPNRQAEDLLLAMNEYALVCRKERIAQQKNEQRLRVQIENISHDLRTPLTAMLGYLELIDKEKLSGEDREAMEVIVRKAKSLRDLIANFYDLSRLELKDYHLGSETVNLSQYTGETMLRHYKELEDRRLDVQLFIGEQPVKVLADTQALERIFANMIQNALRYAESFFHVSLVEASDGYKREVRLIFENDTHTLKQEDMEHLFERFFVADHSRTKQSTGLGLTISRLLMEAMGGSVVARLEEHRLRLTFTFPADILVEKKAGDEKGDGE